MQLGEPTLLTEFLDPPSPEVMGPEGQVVVVLGGRAYRAPVSKEAVGKAAPLPGSGRTFTLLEYAPDFFDRKSQVPTHPAVRFELSGPEGKTECSAFARMPSLATARGAEAGGVGLWYHFPDFRWGAEHLMGAVQFLQGPGGKLYFRVYGQGGLRQKGQEFDPADRAAEYALPWRPMDMRFQVAEYLPHALHEDDFVPRHVRPGAEPGPRLRPTIRATLSVGNRTAEFWARQTGTPAWIELGGEVFVVRYQSDSAPVDFALTLKRARRQTDPGSNRPASFSSDVVLEAGGVGARAGREQTISMNQPLRHGRYTVYQSNYEPLIDPRTHQVVLDASGKMVSLSGLTVAHDPGLWLKYAGSALVVLGIGIMFWMRAYFFRRPATTAP
jgi:hypothetical protein